MIDDKDVDSEVKELYSAFNDMSERLSRYNEQTIESLTFERNKLESVLMSIVNGVVVCDNHDKVIMVNNYAKRLLEVEEEDILHTQIQQFCDSSGEFCFADKITQFKDTPLDDDGAPIPFNIEIDRRILKCLISPMFTRSNSYVGYIIVLIDVTKDVEMDQLRSNFISNVSHELRTPVTVLRSYIDTLYSYGNDFDFNTQREFIGVMNQEIIRLNRMVNDILDFSDFENDNITFNIRPYDAVKLCREASETVSASRKLEVELRYDTELSELMIDTDDARLRQVLINLLVNATKFTKEGSIVLKLELSDPNTAFFSVTDTGCGIPLEKQGLIFERFEKLNDFAQGSGLGLSICQLIVTYMRGRIWVDSNYTQGARFCFTHPLKYKSKEEDAV